MKCGDCNHWTQIVKQLGGGGWCKSPMFLEALNYAPSIPSSQELSPRVTHEQFGCIYFERRPGPFGVKEHAHSDGYRHWHLVCRCCQNELSPSILDESSANRWAEWLNDLRLGMGQDLCDEKRGGT